MPISGWTFTDGSSVVFATTLCELCLSPLPPNLPDPSGKIKPHLASATCCAKGKEFASPLGTHGPLNLDTGTRSKPAGSPDQPNNLDGKQNCVELVSRGALGMVCTLGQHRVRSPLSFSFSVA
jgi:hypothetical protein